MSKVMTSDFYCTKCGRKGIPIARTANSQREPGHLKKLFCLCCGEEINHAEVRQFGKYTYEDFMEEYVLGRFVNGERVPIQELTICTKKDCTYIRNGRCWNANKTHHCQYRREND